jgi:hypothetical protein
VVTRVLIALGNAAETSRISEALRELGDFEVITRSAEGPQGRIEIERPDIALLDAGAIGTTCARCPELRVIACVPPFASRSDFASAFAAGAIDVIREGAHQEEVLGRIANATSVRHTPVPSVTMRLRSVKAWNDLEGIIARELGELLGTSLRCAEGVTRRLVHTSAIPLTSVPGQVSLQLGLGIDARTGGQLSERMLGGDVSGAAMQDALREMCNTAGGAIRRAALDEGLSFSVGLPNDENPFGAGSRRRVFTITDDNGVHLECTVNVSANLPIYVAASDLSEGMVLARDVVDANGDIVHHSGTVLTLTTAASIASLVGEQTSIEINRGDGVASW